MPKIIMTLAGCTAGGILGYFAPDGLPVWSYVGLGALAALPVVVAWFAGQSEAVK